MYYAVRKNSLLKYQSSTRLVIVYKKHCCREIKNNNDVNRQMGKKKMICKRYCRNDVQ